MKNNRKNRKLKFIRYKNAIVKGKRVAGRITVPSELLSKLGKYQIINLCLEQVRSHLKRYKIKTLKPDISSLEMLFGYDGADFVYNRVSCVCKFRLK